MKPPVNMLWANTASLQTTSSARLRTRKVRPRVGPEVMRIGVFDISARAGFMNDVLAFVSRRQARFTFYQIEAQLPTGLGTIGDAFLSRLREDGIELGDGSVEQLRRNIAVQEVFPYLEQTRRLVDVEVVAGLFGPMIAWEGSDGDEDEGLNFNYFSLAEGNTVGVSAYGIREYAQEAGRPFEAALALLTLAEVWSNRFDVPFHKESRRCPFDFCGDRDGLVGVFADMRLCPESLEAVPKHERDDVERCLQALRDYTR